MTNRLGELLRYHRKDLLFLFLLWPLAGTAVGLVGLSTAYVVGSWLQIPVMILLPSLAVGLAFTLLSGLSYSVPDSAVGLTYVYLVLAATAGLLVGYLVGRPYLDLTSAPAAENLLVHQAADYVSPGYRHFRDGRILPEYEGVYTESGIDGDGFYYENQYKVAPVVSSRWRSGDPITIWVVTGSQETIITSFAEWREPIQGMTAMRQISNYRRAVGRAETQHDLVSAENPLLLRLYEQPFAALQARLRQDMQITLLIIAFAGWLPLGVYAARV